MEKLCLQTLNISTQNTILKIITVLLLIHQVMQEDVFNFIGEIIKTYQKMHEHKIQYY